MSDTGPARRDLREACLATALAIVGEEGLEKLSLREVARRLGVSHGAPYKHFPSRDHILAEIVARAFAAFAAHLDASPRTGDARRDMGAMGRAYLAYALDHPLDYRLMFGTPLPDPADHPEMMRQARHAFALLKERLRAVHAADGRRFDDGRLDRDALFVWSTMHGLAGILSGAALSQVGLPDEVLATAPEHALSLIGAALEGSKEGW
ncbi:TetR/AcrR family transcriptional regulator [Methylobacterium nonmethylotrophicum]|uniref:TetR/AcrR family transcriptional regulator n=1 Tax=Methylobacterium nonmethylotrophicum TaxID=1141884 RepID=A0A4Z0NQM1_9HYPH|nr:TetR/AcrR family transcriptional regulator [Methylobacterium nonmethylotrophicum]TGD99049.1 TetR/AcrR family transcriptional regulator [Methylobacterium nonmethylotrophicum]